MKKLPLILVLATFLSFSCQENSEKLLIRNFIQDLFDPTVNPEQVVERYIYIPDEKKSNDSNQDKKDLAIKIIKDARIGQNGSDWFVPNQKIKNLKELNILSFIEAEHLNKLNFNGLRSDHKSQMYVLVDDDEKEILEYFMLSDDKSQIKYFNLFVKGDSASFFEF